ncbi:hypothetical protein BP6252_13060 [Coleophoma cylindrospora]|uniref:DUF7791 domain-containing protein n=1 Tax=Coleophoma cylindrospora TaxID=1849047 RepID=A0A3D8QAS6_9HELO|nr:hypothetical protein BP6252_13060 [Coleophoma cylindrospora]
MGLLEWHASEPLNAFVPRKISFLHRTVRDFLLTPNAQRVLLEFSGGQYDALHFRCNALVFDVIGLSNFPPGRSSHLVRLNNLSCFLGQISQLQSEEKVYSLYDTFLSTIRVSESDWKQLNRDVENEYIKNAPDLLLEATGEWNKDQSTALSLAILFGWTDYVKARLTYEMISEKTGRPLLDYALVPCTRLSKNAHPEIAAHLLRSGADPGELYQGISLWVRYILSLQDLDHCDRVSTFITIETLIRHGVDRFVRISDLQAEPSNEKIRELRVTTLQKMLLHYETHRPAGFDEDAYDVLDVLEAISRSRHWAHAFQFEMKERTRLEKIWSGGPLHLN